jgi:hypothetical protein
MAFYSGIGARVTPPDIQDLMTRLATHMERCGYTLRSGGQPRGADGAFERGVLYNNKNIFYPSSKGGTVLPQAYELAAQYHPIWNRLDEWQQGLMARNVHVILGHDLKSPSDIVFCWTEDGMKTIQERTSKSGGTGHALAIAIDHGIPIYNLRLEQDRSYIEGILADASI